MTHVVVDISAHGFGHLAQTAPLLEALSARRPDVRFTIRCALPAAEIERRIAVPVDIVPSADDFGVVTGDGVEIDVESTVRAYVTLAARWRERLAAEAKALAALKPALLVANTGFLGLAAAAAAGVRGVHLASLDWFTLLKGYAGGDPRITPMMALMAEAYRTAVVRLRLEPGMPAIDGQPARSLSAVARRGLPRKPEILAALSRPADARIVVFAFGFAAPAAPPGDWHLAANLLCLTPGRWDYRPGVAPIDSLPWPFIDLVASADACVSKVGYATVTEAVRNDCPLLYYTRRGWSEDPFLIDWLRCYGRATPIDFEALDAPSLIAAMDTANRSTAKGAASFDADSRFAAIISAMI